MIDLEILNPQGKPVEFETLNLPTDLKDRYQKIQRNKEEINAQPFRDESEEFERKLNSEEFILALEAKKLLESGYRVLFHNEEVTYPFSFRLMADYGPALSWDEHNSCLGGTESVSWLLYPQHIREKLELWDYLFIINDQAKTTDWDEFNLLGLEIARMIKKCFNDLIEIKYRILDESIGFKVTDWEIVN